MNIVFFYCKKILFGLDIPQQALPQRNIKSETSHIQSVNQFPCIHSLAGSNKENIESETAHIKSVYHVSCTHLQVPIKGQFWHWCTSSHRRWNYTVQYQMLHTRHSPCYFYRCLDNSESKIDMLELLQNCNICDILIKWKKDNNECHWYFINL